MFKWIKKIFSKKNEIQYRQLTEPVLNKVLKDFKYDVYGCKGCMSLFTNLNFTPAGTALCYCMENILNNDNKMTVNYRFRLLPSITSTEGATLNDIMIPEWCYKKRLNN